MTKARSTRWRAKWAVAALSAVMGVALLSGAAAGQSGKAGRDEVPSWGWGADDRVMQALSSLADQKPADIRRRAERELFEAVKDPAAAAPDDDLLVRLTVLREFGRMIERSGRLEGAELETARWLLGRERLVTTLMTAMTRSDAPDAALRIVSRIRQNDAANAEKFPELVTALAVVYDSNADMTGENAVAPDPAFAARLFGHYVGSRKRLKLDAPSMPWPLGVFVVQCDVTEPELAWAMSQYAGRGSMRDVANDVRYVENPSYTPAGGGGGGTEGRNRQRLGRVMVETGAAVSPTLEQISRGGGTTRTIAHYAVSVSRALGVPAAPMVGQSETGAIRGWAAVLDTSRDPRAFFDMDVGREDEGVKWPGESVDPQTHEVITDDELTLLAGVWSVPMRQRTLSAALSRLATKPADGAFGEERGKDADRGGGRGPANDGGRDGEFDLSDATRTRLLLRAVELCPSNRAGWAELRRMGRESELSAEGTEKIVAAASKLLAPRFPAVALTVMADAVSWRGSREQVELIDKVKPVFASQPALQMRLMVRRGDLLAEQKKDREALASWGTVVDRAADVGPIALDAMRRIDTLLRGRNEDTLLLATYRSVWTRMPAPRAIGPVRSTAWYQIGQSYADLLEQSGDANGANNVRQRLRNLELNAIGVGVGRTRR